MRILYMANNWVGLQIAQWLREQDEKIVGLVVHPDRMAKYRDEIVAVTGVGQAERFTGDCVNDEETVSAIRAMGADVAVSVSFGFLLRAPIIRLFPKGCINLHPAYLPYNRGGYPNVWSIVEGTPAGVTLHYIDEGVDTGDIIAQQQVTVEPVDTGESLYHKLEQASVDLFTQTWPSIREGTVTPVSQSTAEGTSHRDRDVQKIDHIDLDTEVRAGDLINILRARTFPPHKGAYFVHEGRRIYMRLSLCEDE